MTQSSLQEAYNQTGETDQLIKPQEENQGYSITILGHQAAKSPRAGGAVCCLRGSLQRPRATLTNLSSSDFSLSFTPISPIDSTSCVSQTTPPFLCFIHIHLPPLSPQMSLQ